NHQPNAFKGKLQCVVTDASGSVLHQWLQAVEVPTQTNLLVETLDLSGLRKRYGSRALPQDRGLNSEVYAADRDTFVWISALDEEGNELSCNIAAFSRPKHWQLKQPEFTYNVKSKGGDHCIEIHSSQVSPWTWISLEDTDCRFSDNFLHMRPGQAYTIHCSGAHISAQTLKDKLRIRSLLIAWDK
ncbi:MAG: hypothetical protein LR015_13125, partial [Verrucomicrobia bacterium]|nr:hypothetical protein [Verrucomicrobiota bacterium]